MTKDFIKSKIDIIQLDIDIIINRLQRSTDEDMIHMLEKSLEREEAELQKYKVQYPEYFI